MQDFDVCVIGAGPGGTSAAIESSMLGAKAAIIEDKELGGVCLNRGCIPTKAYLKSASLYEELKRAEEFGLSCNGLSYDLTRIKARAGVILNTLKGQIESFLKARKIPVIKGRASFLDNRRVLVDDKVITARSFIIASGSSPRVLNSIAADNKRVFYSEGILDIASMPSEVTIVGAGPIGCEFASFFSAFGVKIKLLEMRERILPAIDRDLSNRMENVFKRKGIDVLTKVSSFDLKAIGSDVILVSVGRSANVKDMGLDKAGVKLKDGCVVVDKYLQTDSAGIFAAGDCIGRYNLAHMASAEGRIAARNALGNRIEADYNVVPICVYSLPEAASVGLTAEEAMARGYDPVAHRVPFTALGRSHTNSETEGFIKLVADRKTYEVLGAHILGYCACELIGLAGAAIKARLKINELAEIIQPHPSFSEGIQEAAINIARQFK